MPAWVVDLLNRLNSTFVVDGRWQWFVSGLGYTLLISLFSVLLGLVIGILMALMRLSKSKILRAVSGIYIDIIRGTDVYKRQVKEGAKAKTTASKKATQKKTVK